MGELVDFFVDDIFDNCFAYSQSILDFSNKDICTDWGVFQNSWNNLCLDNYMGDNGKYRFRRYSVFYWDNKHQQLMLKSHEPHYQSLTYNTLNGGIPRHYEAFEQHVIDSKCFNVTMMFALDVINKLETGSDWHIEAHQFRILAGDELSKPTPDGVHCDGRDYIIMMLIDKQNVTGGTSTIYDQNKKAIKVITLEQNGQTIMVCDNRTMHGVSPITAQDSNLQGYRDMLVITFINQDKLNDE